MPLKNRPAKAYLLSRPGDFLVTSSGGESLEIWLPAAAPDPAASVIVLDIEGSPQTTDDHP